MTSLTLDGRTALVTGAASGIGAAIADTLAAHGARVVATDIAFPESSIPAAAGAASLDRAVCDVTDPASVARCIATVEQRIGFVDVLVNCAGIYPGEPFEAITLQSWRRVFAVNVDGVFNLCQALVPGMKSRGWGRIVTIGSNTLHTGWENLSHYIASKGAITGLTRALAVELGPYGVTVNVVAPTITRTPGTEPMFTQAPDVVERVVSRQAIPRAGVPGDVASAVLLLCTPAANFITGQTLAADGGLAKH